MTWTKPKKGILWLAYGLSAYVLLLLQSSFFNRLTICGAGPMLLQVCVVCVAIFEGHLPGAVFGLVCGFCLDSISSGVIWPYTAYLAAVGWVVGSAASYTSRGALFSCLVWSLLALLPVAGVQLIWFAVLRGESLVPVLVTAAAQTIYSLIFVLPLCPWMRHIHRRWGND